MLMHQPKFRVALLSAVAAMAIGCSTHGAQSAGPDVPDMTGLFDSAPGTPSTRDLPQYMKKQGFEIPWTPYGREQFSKVDLADNPNAHCLPPGPSRALTGPAPFFIVQHKDVVAIVFENHYVYRLIYLDGRKHPDDIADYPMFMGHSIGHWEGRTLVVDTVGIDTRTWLDSYGLEHSDKLHLTEKFTMKGPDSIEYAVTYDDPVFFTKPWTAVVQFARLKDTRMLEYVCEDNEKDKGKLVPTRRVDTP